jgi:FKBP-type peptidyl-prolyl cis-trans isomerases 2
MKKSEKLKGKEKVQEKAAAKKRTLQIVAVIAVIVIVITGVTAYISLYNPFAVAATGDKVSVVYTGMFENKTVFDTNTNTSPISFTVGSGQMIKGFDAAVQGMKVGETKTVTIPSDQAYGAYDPSLVQIVPKSMFPANTTLYPGEAFGFRSAATGQSYLVHVVNVTSAGVAVDANSALAGQDLVFTIKVTGITKASSGSSAAGSS